MPERVVTTFEEWLTAHIAENGEESMDYVDADSGLLTFAFSDAQNAGVVPDDVLVWWVADADGTVDGAIITVDAPDGKRYASYYLEWRGLMDREAVGEPLLASFFERVLDERQRLLA